MNLGTKIRFCIAFVLFTNFLIAQSNKILITEFMAVNSNTIVDENLEHSD